jgi:hypothetical protein
MFFISLLLLACPGDDFDPDIQITYINNADFDIVRLPLRFTSEQLPDNTPFENQSFIDARVITANTTKLLEAESNNIMSNGLVVVFLSREVVETVPWEQIREENMVLKTFDLTLEELEAMDFILEYP